MGFFSELFQSLFSGFSNTVPTTKPTPVCPNCSIEMEPFQVGSMLADVCPKCSGIWLSPAFFEAVLDAADDEVKDVPDDGEMSDHTFDRSPSSRICPNCDSRMENYQYNYTSGIWIDACPNSHGIWLDPGELEMVRSQHRRMHLPPTAEEKYKMATAFVDGASKTMGNMNKITTEIYGEWHRRHGGRYIPPRIPK